MKKILSFNVGLSDMSTPSNNLIVPSISIQNTPKHFQVNKPSNFPHLCVYYGCHPLYILLKFMKIKRQGYVWTSVYLKIVNAKDFNRKGYW